MAFKVPGTKEYQLNQILQETEVKFTWQCPNCCVEHESDGSETIDEFVQDLYKKHQVRYVVMDMMQGVFCEECYTNPEVQSSTL